MIKTPPSHLKDSEIAIVAMGQSQLDFHLARTHSVPFDEIWAINAMIGVLPDVDRAFILDPMSRFFDSEDAGTMTPMMRNVLPTLTYPVYSCELDSRVPAVEEYPLEEVVTYAESAYLNNTVAYALAFAFWSKVKQISMFGVDFTYKTNMHFAEAGRGCVEFWLSKCINSGMMVGIAPRSSLLDTDVDLKDKLYGYHRLSNPKIAYRNGSGLKIHEWSKFTLKQNPKPVGIINRKDLTPVEPKEF
tara:strand:+ start:2044 stop:2778 length:735 start_codon:yes stop_codon:yes gene_type:complete